MERRFIFFKTVNESQLSDAYWGGDKHVGKCFKTCSSGSDKPSVLANSQLQFCLLQPGVQDLWKPYSLNDDVQDKLINSTSHDDTQLDELADQIHSCLDLLPAPGTYLLDILWLCDTPPGEFPPALYGALKRAVAWHGAMLSVIMEENMGVDVPSWFLPLRAEILPMSMLCACHSLSEFLCPHLAWRGNLAFYNQEDFDVLTIQGFELHATRDVFDWTKEDNNKMSGRLYFSGNLEVVSEVPLSSVLPHLLTKDKLVLKTSILGDEDMLASDFMSETFPTPNSALVVKLKYSVDKPRIDMKKLKTEHWKSQVNYNMDPTPPCQSMGEDVSSITLLVFDDPDASEDCTRNVMQKSAVIFKNVQDVHFASTLKEMNFEGETKCDEEKLANAKNLIDFPQFRVDESKIEQLKNYVNEVQVDVIKMLIQENSELIQNEQKIEDVRIAIANHLIPQLMESLKFAVMFGSVEESDFLFPKVDEMTVNSEDWQEARFLAFLQKHHDKTEREIRDSQPNKQIKDYVLLEAKELLKFFDKDGLAAKVENLELMEAKNRNCPLRPQKSEKEYEEYFKENFKKVTHDYSGFEFTGNYKDFTKMEFTQHHDVYYNNGDKAEAYDKECTKMHLVHVGLIRETASTFVSGPDTERLPVAPRLQSGPKETNKENQVRRSPRKKLAPPKRPGLVAKKSPKLERTSQAHKVTRPQAVRDLQLAKKLNKSPSKKTVPIKPLQNRTNPKTGGLVSKGLQGGANSKPTGTSSKALPGRSRTEATKDLNSASKTETAEESNVKKLRVAVYAALKQEGVAEKDAMFKPCFRKLFNICKMCLQDAMSKRDDSIADMMYDMAKMNVKNVIKMEKMTRK